MGPRSPTTCLSTRSAATGLEAFETHNQGGRRDCRHRAGTNEDDFEEEEDGQDDPSRRSNAVLAEGDQAPAFTLPDQNGDKVSCPTSKDRRWSSISIQGPTPPAARPRPAASATAAPSSRRRGAGDRHLTRRGRRREKFAGKYDLDFTLLADADHAVAEKYGAWVEKSMYGNKYMGVAGQPSSSTRKGRSPECFPRSSPKNTTFWC